MLSRRRFHLQTAALLGLTGGGAWAVGCGVALVGARRWTVTSPGGGVRPVLVLGCRPGPAFERRLAAAAALYGEGRAAFVVVSGRDEAAWGAGRLRAAGVPAAHIREEPTARNTYENLVCSRETLGDAPFYLVTDTWHLPRAAALARALGLAAVPVPVAVPARVGSLLREGMSVVMSVSGGHVALSEWVSVLRSRSGSDRP